MFSFNIKLKKCVTSINVSRGILGLDMQQKTRIFIEKFNAEYQQECDTGESFAFVCTHMANFSSL